MCGRGGEQVPPVSGLMTCVCCRRGEQVPLVSGLMTCVCCRRGEQVPLVSGLMTCVCCRRGEQVPLVSGLMTCVCVVDVESRFLLSRGSYPELEPYEHGRDTEDFYRVTCEFNEADDDDTTHRHSVSTVSKVSL